MQYRLEGGSLPAVIINLNPGETMISEAGGRTWSRGAVDSTVTTLGGAGKALGRMLMGESLFMNLYTAQEPAEIAFSSSFPGRIVARELGPGQSIICQKHAFLCATYGVELSMFFQKKLGAGLVGGEGFIMQKVTGPGLVFLEVDGYCQDYDLAPGERLVCDTGVLAVMDETCSMDVQMVKGVKNVIFGGESLLCVPLKTEHRKESHIPFLFPSSLQVLLSVSVLERGRVPQKWQPQPPDRSPYTHEPQAAFPAHCDCDFQFDRNAPFPESVLHKLYLFSPIESQPSPGIPLRKRGIPSR